MQIKTRDMSTRIAVRDEDCATPQAMAEDLHRAIKGATLTVFKGARHRTPFERPERVAEELRILWPGGKRL